MLGGRGFVTREMEPATTNCNTRQQDISGNNSITKHVGADIKEGVPTKKDSQVSARIKPVSTRAIIAEQIKKKSCILVSKHETWHDCSQWSTLPKKLLGHSKNPRWPPFSRWPPF